MFDFAKSLLRIILVYLVSVPIIIFLGSFNENLGHIFLFGFSALLSVGVLYEIWVGCRLLRQVKYPAPKEIRRLRTLRYLRDMVVKATGGHEGAFRVLTAHLRHIYLERVLDGEHSRRVDLEEFLTEQKQNVVSKGDAELASLLLAEGPGTQEGRLELLNEILERMEV